MITPNDLDVFDDTREATKTARSILRSKLIEVLKQVDDNKHPQVGITENCKEIPSLNANWAKADTEREFKTTVIPTKKQEELKEHEAQGIEVEE